MRSLFLIWSIEHSAWWAPGERGYTTILAEAGFYLALDAERIVSDANRVKVNECMIPLSCMLGSLPSWTLAHFRAEN